MKVKESPRDIPKIKPKKHHPKPVTFKQLQLYRGFLEALANVKNDQDLVEIMQRMKNADFQMVCTCVNHFLHDDGPMTNYLNEKEATKLKGILHPWKRHLRKLTNEKLSIKEKKQLLKRKQRGGNGNASNGDTILASVVGGLMPMVIDGLTKAIGAAPALLAAPEAAVAL